MILELLKKTLNVFIIRVCSIFFGFLFTYFVAQFYKSEGLGIFALFQSVLMISILLSLFGTDISSVKFISKYFSDRNYKYVKSVYIRVVKIMLPISLLLSIAIYLCRFFLSDLIFKNPNLETAISLSAFCIIPLSFIYIHSESLRGMRKVELYSLLKYLLIPFFAIIYMFFLNDNNLFTPIISYVFAVFITSILSFIIWIYKSQFLLHKTDKSLQINVLESSYSFFISSSMLLLLQWIDVLFLGYFKSASDVGIYAVTVKISMFSSIILFSINSIVAPKISDYFTKNKIDEFKEIIKKSSKLMFFLTMPVLIFVIILSDFILNIFGAEFLIGKTALRILVLGQFFNVLCGSVGYILNMTENHNIFRNIAVFAVLVNIILNLVLIPVIGIEGAAIASMVSLVLWNLISFIYIYKKFNVSTIWFLK